MQEMVRADKQLSARLSTEFERQRSEQSQKDAELSKLQQELNERRSELAVAVAQVEQLQVENSDKKAEITRLQDELGAEAGKGKRKSAAADSAELKRLQEELRRQQEMSDRLTEQLGVASTAVQLHQRKQKGRSAAKTVAAKFEEQIMAEMARRKQEGEESDLASIFESFDTDGDGTLSRKELVLGLRDFGIRMSKAEAKELMSALDADGDGTIEWEEFAEVIIQAHNAAKAEREAAATRESEAAAQLAALQEAEAARDREAAAHRRKQNLLTAAQQVAAKFEGQIMEEMARRQQEGEEGDLASIFESFDTDEDGTLSRKELIIGLRDFGIRMSKTDTQELMSLLDADDDGTIEWKEFVEVIKEAHKQAKLVKQAELARQKAEAARHKASALHKKKAKGRSAAQKVAAKFEGQIMAEMARRKQEGEESDLASIFESFDLDGDGTLSRKELMIGLREFGISMSKTDAQELMSLLDADEDGTIEWEEFVEVIKEAHKQAKLVKQAEDAEMQAASAQKELQEFARKAEQDAAAAEEKLAQLERQNRVHAEKLGQMQSRQPSMPDSVDALRPPVSPKAPPSAGTASDAETVSEPASGGESSAVYSEDAEEDDLVPTRKPRSDSSDSLSAPLRTPESAKKKKPKKERGRTRSKTVGGSAGTEDMSDTSLDFERTPESPKKKPTKKPKKKPKAPVDASEDSSESESESEPEPEPEPELVREPRQILVDGLMGLGASMQKALSEHDLKRLVEPLGRMAYQSVADLESAEDDELDGVIEKLELVPPEVRRFKKAIALAREIQDELDEAEQEAADKATAASGPDVAEGGNDEKGLLGKLAGSFSRRLKEKALPVLLQKHGLGRLEDELTKQGYVFPSDLREASEEERDRLTRSLGLEPPEVRRWQELLEIEDGWSYNPEEIEEAETLAKRLDNQKLTRIADELAKRGYHDTEDLLTSEDGEDPEVVQEELDGLVKDLDLKPPEARRLRKAIVQEQPEVTNPVGELAAALGQISLARLVAPLQGKGYLTVNDLVETNPIELSHVLKTAELTPPELRRWTKMLEEAAAGHFSEEAPEVPEPQPDSADSVGQLLAAQRLDEHGPALAEMGYLSPADLVPLADEDNEDELAAVVRELGLKAPEERRLRAAVEAAEEVAEALAEAMEEDDLDDDERAQLLLADVLPRANLGKHVATLAAKGYRTVGDLPDPDEQDEEQAALIRNLRLSPPEFRRWQGVLGNDEADNYAPPRTFIKALTLQQLEDLHQPLAERGYMELADLVNATDAERTGLFKSLGLTPPQVRRLEKVMEEVEDDGEQPEVDDGEMLDTALARMNLGRLAAPLNGKGYRTVADLRDANELARGLELASLMQGVELNAPEWRRWQMVLGADGAQPLTMREALAAQNLEQYEAKLAGLGYEAVYDLVGLGDDPDDPTQELEDVVRELGLKPPERRRLEQVIEDNAEEEVPDPEDDREDEAKPLHEALRAFNLSSVTKQLNDMGFLTLADLRSIAEEQEEMAEVMDALSTLKPPEKRRLRALGEWDPPEEEDEEPEDSDTPLGQALTAAGVGRLGGALERAGYESVADLLEAGTEELEEVMRLKDLNPPETRRLKKFIENYGSDVAGPEEETLEACLTRQGIERLQDDLVELGYPAVSDLKTAPSAELEGVIQSLGLRKAEGRRLKKALGLGKTS